MKPTPLQKTTTYTPESPQKSKQDKRKGSLHYQWQGTEHPHPLGTMFGHWRVVSSKLTRINGYPHTNLLCTHCGREFVVLLKNAEKGLTNSCSECNVVLRNLARNLKKWGRNMDDNDRVLQVRWNAIWHRCENRASPSYANYGARGIRLSSEFLSDVAFVNYLKSLPDCPAQVSKQHTIDRINNEKGYERGNLKFSTHKQQMRNLRTTQKIAHEGKTYDARTFAELFLHRCRPTTAVRLIKQGLSAEQIIEKDATDPHIGRRWTTCV